MVIGKCTDVFRVIFFGLGAILCLVRGGGYVGGSFLGGICHGGREIQWKGAGFSSITIKKNNEKINMKKFFQLKVRSSIKLKTNRDYYAYEGF